MRALGMMLALASVAGCGSVDPCSGFSGTCVTLTVQSATAHAVDHLRITASGAANGTQTSASAALTLPVHVALHLGATASGNLHIVVTASDGNTSLGSGATDVAVIAGKHQSAAVTLGPIGDGGAPSDGGSDNDLAGSDGGGGGSGDGGSCVAADSTCSASSMLHQCKSDGSGFTDIACPFDCSTTGGAHCNAFYPTAPVTNTDVTSPGLATITVGAFAKLNTDTGALDNVRPATGDATMPDTKAGVTYVKRNGVGVFIFGGLTISDGITLQLVGSSPVALVSTGDITVTGIIDARGYDVASSTICKPATAGPGGSVGGMAQNSAPGPGGGGAVNKYGSTAYASGSGGGGHGAIGGAGGACQNGSTPALMGDGGVAGAISDAMPFKLIGGWGGGGGNGYAGGGVMGGQGGGGGGAVQLVAVGKITIGGGAAVGGINAGGCGGYLDGGMGGSGGGGGAGGAVLLEAPVVIIGAKGGVAVNGGGGASAGQSGQAALLSTASATGGVGGTNGFGAGGRGSNITASGSTAGTPGIVENCGVNSTYGGGSGGGGSGLILINNRSASLTVDPNGFLSPALGDKNTQMLVVTNVGAIDLH